MKVLKDIAAAMDNHPKTAVKWIKRLGVPADVKGHGPNKWEDESFNRLIALYKQFYKQAGTTPKIVRSKYAGDLTDARQIEFTFRSHFKIQRKK